MRGFSFIVLGLVLSLVPAFAQQTETLAITLQGKGACTTRPFTVQDNWHIESTGDSAIKVQAQAPDGSNATTLVDSPATTPPSPSYSATSAPVAKGGSFTLAVTTTGAWQVTIFESGFTKNLAIGGTTPFSPAPPTTNAAPVASTPAPIPSPTNPNPMMRDHLVTFFSGVGQTTSRPFTVANNWELRWTAFGPTKITLMPTNGTRSTVITDGISNPAPESNPAFSPPAPYAPPQGSPSMHLQRGTSYQATGGDFTLLVEGSSPWNVRIVEINANAPVLASTSPDQASGTPPPTPVAPAPTVKLTDDQARAVVLIVGDNAEGTGFLVKTPQGPAIVTNIHVIANNPNLKVTTNTGALVNVLSAKGASDRDLAMLSIQDANYSYLEVSTDISQTVQPGDEVITPGNSQGGEVMLNTAGKVLGIGPERIEIDNPIYHGNSGGPIFHTKSGKVLGVVTEAIKVDTDDDLDKASFASRNSAITGSMRYFGLRLDTVSNWITIDWKRFQIETAFLDQFHKESLCLDSYLNTSDNQNGSNSSDANLYRSNEKIMKANAGYIQEAAGADIAQRIQAARGLVFDLQGIADNNLDQIQVANNFYSFNQERARDETAYRKALKNELDSISSNVDRLGSLPRSNN